MTIKSLINEINAQQHLTDNEKILFVGSALGLIDEIRTALSRDDVNPNCQISWDGSTPLHLAVHYEEKEAVQYLILNESVDVNHCCKEGASPLYIAAQSNSLDIAALLLSSKNIDVNQSSASLPSALYIAAQKGLAEMVKLLLEHDEIKPNSIFTDTGATPLCIAAHNGHLSVIEAMIACKKVDVQQVCNDGVTALDYAKHKQHMDIVDILTKIIN